MDFSLVYLLWRAVYRFVDFFHHWYVDGSRQIANRFVATLESTDRYFALQITLRHFFEPLYKDYSVIGRILGVVFRAGRVTAGTIVYLFIAAIFACIYLVWLAIPALIIYYAVRHL